MLKVRFAQELAGSRRNRNARELTFNALGGQNPPAQTIAISTACGESISWEVAADAPWLHVEPANAMIDIAGAISEVTIDLAGLDPDEAPFNGTLTLSSPQGGNTLLILVRLEILP